MMRTVSPDDHARRAGLFEAYFPVFLRANLAAGEQVSIARTLPHEQALPKGVTGDNTTILDYERAFSRLSIRPTVLAWAPALAGKKNASCTPNRPTPARRPWSLAPVLGRPRDT